MNKLTKSKSTSSLGDLNKVLCLTSTKKETFLDQIHWYQLKISFYIYDVKKKIEIMEYKRVILRANIRINNHKILRITSIFNTL